MLIEFRLKNYRSFSEEQVLSLVAGTDDSLKSNCISTNKLKLVKAAAIYGPNASGKSNLIKAMLTMKKIVIDSANQKPKTDLPVEPFILDDAFLQEPCFFEVTFLCNNIRYQYGFTLTAKRIYDEWLIAYPKGHGQTWFKRSLDTKKSITDWNFSSYFRGDKSKLVDMTRDNVLFLSAGAQWNNEQLSIVYNWFMEHLRIIPAQVALKPVTAKWLHLAETEKDNSDETFHELISQFLKKADLGISGVNVKKVKPEDISFPEDTPQEIQKRILEEMDTDPIFDVKMIHQNIKTGQEILIPLEEESDGTKRFFELLGPFLETHAIDLTVFIDEIDTSLHPLLSRELIKFILSKKVKNSGPQLVFSTHDTTLLDPGLFRRDQIWFTEKNESGATDLYSLHEYKKHRPRKDEAMQKGYLSGRYGAIPIIQAFDDNED